LNLLRYAYVNSYYIKLLVTGKFKVSFKALRMLVHGTGYSTERNAITEAEVMSLVTFDRKVLETVLHAAFPDFTSATLTTSDRVGHGCIVTSFVT
jgi:hypothetical protein